MKRSIILSAIVGLFLVFSASTIQAQEGLKNATTCPIQVKWSYAITGTCAVIGTGTVIVPAMTSFNAVTPFGTSFVQVKGVDVGNLCPVFDIFNPLCGFPGAMAVPCAPCGGYTATYFPGSGVLML